MTPDRSLLLEILSWARPHKSECERRFAREFLDTVPGMTSDGFGNRMLTIGDKPNVMWSSHIDTVANRGGHQMLQFDPATGIVMLAKGKAGMSLGADDGAGVWIMLEMIRAQRPGLYVFHRGEELGCLGSRYILNHTPHVLEGIDAAIAFDRKGTGDVITWQSSGRTASDDFAWSLAGLLSKTEGLRYVPDDGGVFTDTDTYSGVIAECSNLSVGYEGNHGPRETLDVYHAERLLEAMLTLDTAELTIARDPGDDGYDLPPGWAGSGWRRDTDELPFGDLPDLIDAVTRYPEAAARILLDCGVDIREVEDRGRSLQDSELDYDYEEVA